MKTLSLALAAVGSLFLLASVSAHASVITFDDLSGNDVDIGNGYGLNWSGFSSQSNTYFSSDYGITGTGFDDAAVSGANYATNDYGSPASFSVASGTLNFASAYFTSAYDPNQQITVTGLLKGNQVYSTTFSVSDTGPTLESFNWSGIDDVTVSPIDGGNGSFVAVDNLSVSAVPLPAALPLFGSAFAGLVALSRRRRAVLP
jgi:hypothetical protein